MHRLEVINHLIEKNQFERYLEIGVDNGYVLDNCIAKYKLGVDPNRNAYTGENMLIDKTSDEFFDVLGEDNYFDIVFIDGMHEAEQVFRDITNSMNHLNEGGLIVLHDCNPPTKEHACSYEEYLINGGNWNGDVYKGYLDAIATYDIENYTVNTDWGVGVLMPKDVDLQSKRIKLNLSWEDFEKNKKELLNLISIDEFKNLQ